MRSPSLFFQFCLLLYFEFSIFDWTTGSAFLCRHGCRLFALGGFARSGGIA